MEVTETEITQIADEVSELRKQGMTFFDATKKVFNSHGITEDWAYISGQIGHRLGIRPRKKSVQKLRERKFTIPKPDYSKGPPSKMSPEQIKTMMAELKELLEEDGQYMD